MKSRISQRALLCASCAGVLYAAPAHADVTVSTDSETALVTSTDGDIVITEDGSLDVEASDPLTLDSDNSITIDEDGEVLADDADGRNGILVVSGTDGTITNNGTISVSEDFVPEDADGNSTPDGPIAEALNRTGILVNSVDGSIENAGAIYVEGLNSAGIQFADGWAGDFDNSGSIAVVGDNSAAISTGSVAGDLSIGGTVTTIGEGAQILRVDGDVDGQLLIDGTLTLARSYTNDDGTSYVLSRSQLRDATPAVEITGNVANGILIDAPPLDLDEDNDDEDGDGVDDDEQTTGSITASGESPALLIGSGDDIVIGSTQTRDGTYSLGIDGSVSATGYYSTFDASAIVIGGQGGSVSLDDGISVGGSVAAVTPDSNAVAILINEDVTVPSLYVSGSIAANIVSQGEGSAVAVRDLSGTLATVDNTGYISVSGAAEDETVALDLSNNTTGVTISQYLNDVDAAAYATELEDEDYDPDSPTIYTAISGDILTGSGNDMLTASSGGIYGDAYLGDGDDTVILSGNTIYSGGIYSQSGAFSLSLSDTSSFAGVLDVASTSSMLTLNDDTVFSGTTENAENLSVIVNGGLLQAPDGEVVAFDNLTVAADGSIGIIVNTADATQSSFDVTTASFEEGAGVFVEIDEVVGADGSYLVLSSDTLSGQDGLGLSTDSLPLIYSATLSSTDTTISVDVARKSAAELGLSVSQSAAYEAILQTVAEDAYLEATILQAEDVEELGSQFNQLLPEYDTGVLDFVSRSSRLASRRVTDRIGSFPEWPVGIWIEPFAFRGSKNGEDTDGYSMSGMGISAGWERRLGDYYVGVSGSWASGSVDAAEYRTIDISKYEAGLHGRMELGGFYAFARASFIWANMDLANSFTGTIDDTDFTYASAADWSGHGYSASVGGSYDIVLTDKFTLRPKVVLDHFSLSENGYESAGDSDAIELVVEDRDSDTTAITPTLIASYTLGDGAPSDNPLTVELEGGYRSVLSGSAGSVTATFAESDSFTLLPSSLDGGWTAEARLKAGGWDHSWQIGIGAEQTAGDIDLSARASLNIAF